MCEEFVTLSEAADLEEIKYKTMAQRISREKELFDLKTEKSTTGGKDIVYISIKSLSNKAKSAWKKREEIKQLTEVDGIQEKPATVDIPWYADTDYEWYMAQYKKSYHKAVELGNVVREYLDKRDREKGNVTLWTEQFARDRTGQSGRTFRRSVDSYLEACAWADRMEKENGCSYDFLKILSLCRKPKDVGQFPSFTSEVKQCIKNIWFNPDFAANGGTREMLYDKLKEVQSVNKWERIPSYQSVTRYIGYLMKDEGLRNAWYLAARGEREYRNKVMVKGSRDTKGLRCMEILMGDEHTFDCWVAYKNPNGSITPIKPKLVAWVDMRSRMVFGDVICKDANTDILKQSVLKMIYHDAGSNPKYLYIDNGKDYTSKEMTGYDRKDRRKQKQEDKMSGYFDDVARGFYKSIGIIDDHEALPYQPWSKGQVERFFGGVCTRFTKWFSSYTGTLTGSKTDAKVPKDIKRMCEDGKLLTMEEFFSKWSSWLHDVYAKKQHRGLKKAGEEWGTPEQVFENAERYFKAAPPKEYATMLMMKSDNVRVYQTGIQKFGYEYRSDELWDYIDQRVAIKYDPDDIKTLYVFDKNGKKIGQAYAKELLHIESEVSEKTLQHIKDQKRMEKRDKERMKEANIPFEKINEQYVGFSTVTGGINLMMEAQGKKKSKVVAIPEDRTYRNNTGKIREEKLNPYMEAQAQKALEKLRAIGEQ